MAVKKASEKNALTYKGKILSRKDNKIYLGNPGEKFYVEMVVLATEKINELDISTKITIKLMENAGEASPKEIKKAEREGLFAAVDIASIWLEDALSEE